MAITPFAHDPADGWANTTAFPTNPDTEAQSRAMLQELHDQTRDFINALITTYAGTGGASEVGITAISGLTASTVQAALAALYAKFANYVATSVIENTLTNSTSKIPSSAAVTAAMVSGGLGDMLTAVFATNGATGKVDTAINAEKLGNVAAADYATLTAMAAAIAAALPTAVSDLTNDSEFITASDSVSKLKAADGTEYTFYGPISAAEYATKSSDTNYATTMYLVPIT